MLDDLNTRFDSPLYRKPILRPRGVESARSNVHKRHDREKRLAFNYRNGLRYGAAVIILAIMVAASELGLITRNSVFKVLGLPIMFMGWLVLCAVCSILVETMLWHRFRNREGVATEEFRRDSSAADSAPADYYDAARSALGFSLRVPSSKLRVEDGLAFFAFCGAVPFAYEAVVRAAEYLHLRLSETELDDIIDDLYTSPRNAGQAVRAVAEGLHRVVRDAVAGPPDVDLVGAVPSNDRVTPRGHPLAPSIDRVRIDAAERLTAAQCAVERQLLPVKLIGRLIPVIVLVAVVEAGWVAGSLLLSVPIALVAMLAPAYVGFRFAGRLARRLRREALADRVPMGNDAFLAAIPCANTDRSVVLVLRSLLGVLRGMPTDLIYPTDTHEALLYPLRYSALQPFPAGALVAAARRTGAQISHNDAERLSHSSLPVREVLGHVASRSPNEFGEIDGEQSNEDDTRATASGQ